MSNYTINHLRELESEAIFVIREVAAQFEKPALLFSGGKDSILMTHLAKKAFYPARIPFPLIHIDTGHNFPETIEFRDNLVKNLGVTLVVGSVQEAIDKWSDIKSKNKLSDEYIKKLKNDIDIFFLDIEKYLSSLACEEIKVPYKTNVWLAQKK